MNFFIILNKFTSAINIQAVLSNNKYGILIKRRQIIMNTKNLTQLLESNTEARSYFDTLPEFVRETLMQSKGDISDLSELKNCAQNLCREGGKG